MGGRLLVVQNARNGLFSSFLILFFKILKISFGMALLSYCMHTYFIFFPITHAFLLMLFSFLCTKSKCSYICFTITVGGVFLYWRYVCLNIFFVLTQASSLLCASTQRSWFMVQRLVHKDQWVHFSLPIFISFMAHEYSKYIYLFKDHSFIF